MVKFKSLSLEVQGHVCLQGITRSENPLNHRVPWLSIFNAVEYDFPLKHLCKHLWQNQRTGSTGHSRTINSFLIFNNRKPRKLNILNPGREQFGRGPIKKCELAKKKRTGQESGKESSSQMETNRIWTVRSRLIATPRARRPSGNLRKEATLRL